MNEFEQLTAPLIEWLKKNHHPHTTIIIDCNHAELLEGIQCYQILQDNE